MDAMGGSVFDIQSKNVKLPGILSRTRGVPTAKPAGLSHPMHAFKFSDAGLLYFFPFRVWVGCKLTLQEMVIWLSNKKNLFSFSFLLRLIYIFFVVGKNAIERRFDDGWQEISFTGSSLALT